jgi:hypothetical protein
MSRLLLLLAAQLLALRAKGDAQVLAQACFSCKGCKVHDDGQVQLQITVHTSVRACAVASR